jgi:hypothetical protein
MSTTYSWKITSIKKVDTPNLPGVIFQTHWKKIGTDSDGNTGEFNGATPFDPKTVDPENFTAFENLTEEQVLGWIQAVVVGDYERHVNSRIAEQIEAKRNPSEEVSDGALPWQPIDTTVTVTPTPATSPEEE